MDKWILSSFCKVKEAQEAHKRSWRLRGICKINDGLWCLRWLEIGGGRNRKEETHKAEKDPRPRVTFLVRHLPPNS